MASGTLVVRDFDEWYAEAEKLKGTAVVDLFMEYEEAVNQAFPGRRIVTLRTYRGRDASEVLDVAPRHGCTLEHPGEGWRIVTAR